MAVLASSFEFISCTSQGYSCQRDYDAAAWRGIFGRRRVHVVDLHALPWHVNVKRSTVWTRFAPWTAQAMSRDRVDTLELLNECLPIFAKRLVIVPNRSKPPILSPVFMGAILAAHSYTILHKVLIVDF